MFVGFCRSAMWALAGLACVSATACSTVVMKEPAAVSVAASPDRDALAAAAAAVSDSKWPKPDAADLGGLFSLGGGRVTESDAVDAYIASLGQGPGRGVSVLKDAYLHIDAAYALARAADQAVSRVEPVADDVRLVENAISDLRKARNVYLASLKTLEKSGDGVESRTANALKGAFDDAIREIGVAADAMSDRLARAKVDAARAAAPLPSRFAAGGAS